MMFLNGVFSPFSMFFRISVLFRVSVMSLITAVSCLDQGFALIVIVIPVAGDLVYALRH